MCHLGRLLSSEGCSFQVIPFSFSPFEPLAWLLVLLDLFLSSATLFSVLLSWLGCLSLFFSLVLVGPPCLATKRSTIYLYTLSQGPSSFHPLTHPLSHSPQAPGVSLSTSISSSTSLLVFAPHHLSHSPQAPGVSLSTSISYSPSLLVFSPHSLSLSLFLLYIYIAPRVPPPLSLSP